MAKNYKICSSCKKEIPKISKKCPFCKNYQKTYIPSPLLERNLKIVDLLNSGDFTLQQVADMMRISTRERVRQIYKSVTNEPYASKHGKKQKILKTIVKQKKLKETKYRCRGCGKQVTFEESGHKSRYCLDCWKISETDHRIPYIYLQCLGCPIKFHPFRNWRLTRAASLFHSMECYLIYKRLHKMGGRHKKAKALEFISKSETRSEIS